jgi:hypothetical protein
MSSGNQLDIKTRIRYKKELNGLGYGMNMKMASARKLMKLWKELWAHHVGGSLGNYERGC